MSVSADDANLAPCAFRERVAGDGPQEVAVCGLVKALAGVSDDAPCVVRRDACEACSRDERPSPEQINAVVASVLYGAASSIIERGGVAGCDVREASALKRWATDNLLAWPGPTSLPGGVWADTPAQEYLSRGRTYACNVVLCCDDSSNQTKRAIQSVLSQQAAATVVHLVDNGGGGRNMVDYFANHGEVFVHHSPQRKSPLAALHDLVGELRTPYVALQDPRTTSRPCRVSYSVGLMEDHGAEILAAVMRTPQGDALPAPVGSAYRRYLPWPTLVLRRDSLVDMGGVADRQGDDDVELVWRAYHEGRSILLAREITVDAEAALEEFPPGPPPRYQPRDGCLHHHARGFATAQVACNVVVPFFAQLDYVRESVEALLSQQGADVVIHLIDDASPEDKQPLLRALSGHPQVRIYRNLQNLGQFTSFNNVVPYLETELVAVSDGNNVSLPHRLHWAGNLLRLTGAGMLGSAFRAFHTHPPAGAAPGGASPATVRHCGRVTVSPLPKPGILWFLHNPTAVMRKEAFVALGGFADFGDPMRNRCTLDIEFYLRAYYAGVRTAFSRRPSVLYRQHPDQATRNSVTGSHTAIQNWANAECALREKIYRTSRFDPLVFGALGKYSHLTQKTET